MFFECDTVMKMPENPYRDSTIVERISCVKVRELKLQQKETSVEQNQPIY